MMNCSRGESTRFAKVPDDSQRVNRAGGCGLVGVVGAWMVVVLIVVVNLIRWGRLGGALFSKI